MKLDNLSEMLLIIGLKEKLNKIIYIKHVAECFRLVSISFLSYLPSVSHERLTNIFTDLFDASRK